MPCADIFAIGLRPFRPPERRYGPMPRGVLACQRRDVVVENGRTFASGNQGSGFFATNTASQSAMMNIFLVSLCHISVRMQVIVQELRRDGCELR